MEVWNPSVFSFCGGNDTNSYFGEEDFLLVLSPGVSPKRHTGSKRMVFRSLTLLLTVPLTEREKSLAVH